MQLNFWWFTKTETGWKKNWLLGLPHTGQRNKTTDKTFDEKLIKTEQ